MRHADPIQRSRHALLAPPARHPPVDERQLDVLFDAEISDQIEGLKDEPDLLIAQQREPGVIELAHGLIDWSVDASTVVLSIVDEGSGVSNPDNLFVPLFTTKPGGSGIGLVLARNIVEAHGGQLRLDNRQRASGCVARITLPRLEQDRDTPERDPGQMDR
jgi:signal transduction histidine kinase